MYGCITSICSMFIVYRTCIFDAYITFMGINVIPFLSPHPPLNFCSPYSSTAN